MVLDSNKKPQHIDNIKVNYRHNFGGSNFDQCTNRSLTYQGLSRHISDFTTSSYLLQFPLLGLYRSGAVKFSLCPLDAMTFVSIGIYWIPSQYICRGPAVDPGIELVQIRVPSVPGFSLNVLNRSVGHPRLGPTYRRPVPAKLLRTRATIFIVSRTSSENFRGLL